VQRQSNFANGGIYTVIDINENVGIPESLCNLFAGNQLSMSFDKQDQQLHRPSFEPQAAVAPLEQVPRRIQSELTKMESLRRTSSRPGC